MAPHGIAGAGYKRCHIGQFLGIELGRGQGDQGTLAQVAKRGVPQQPAHVPLKIGQQFLVDGPIEEPFGTVIRAGERFRRGPAHG